jgi:uncharacterized protein (DUF4415 family)
MAIYAGFVPTQAINWAELSEDLAGKVYQVGEERQKKRNELDKIATDNQKTLAEFEPGKNQSLRELTLRGADQGRVLIKQWNDQLKAGIISPTDYKNKMNNLMESWGVFAKSAKSYDERYLEVMSRQQPGKDGKVAASAYEVDVLTREFGDMSDLSNKTTHFDNDGRVYMATTDKNTGQIIGDVYDVRTMSYPNNIFANRVYVDDQVNDVVKNWDTKTLFEKAAKSGELTIESAKNQDSYKIMVERLANTIAPDNNPRAQVSILIDNGVIQNPIYYKNDDEYDAVKKQAINKLVQEKKNAGIEKTEPTKEELATIELSIIKNQQGADGIINPVLTKKQRDEARERVKQSVDIQLAEKIKKDMPNIVRGGGDGTPKEVDTTLRDILVEAWAGGPGSINTLNANLRDKGYEFKPGGRNPQGQYTMKLVSRRPDAEGNEVVIVPASSNLNDFDPFFYGTGATGAKTAKKQREAAGGTPAKTNITKATSQSDFDNKWNKLKPGEKLIAPTGKIYTKG